MSNSRLKHPISENDKFKLVSEIISFSFSLRNSAFGRERRASGLNSLFHKSEVLTAINFLIYDRFSIAIHQHLNLKHQQFKNSKTKLVNELVFMLFLNKCVAFFGTPGMTTGKRQHSFIVENK